MPLGLEGGHVTAVAFDPRSPDVVFVGADEGGIWRSTNGGQSWSLASVGCNASTISVLKPDLTVASRWWAATNLGLFRTDDGGDHWYVVNTGLMGSATALTTLVLDGNAIYVASNVGTTSGNATVRRSTDEGQSWQVLTIPVMDTVNGFAARGMWLLAATWSGLWVSTDGGANWTQSMGGLASSLVDAVFLDPTQMDTVYASTTLGLSISTDRAMSFTTAAGGLPTGRLEQLSVTSAGLFASMGLDLYRSADRGTTWSASPLASGRAVLAVGGDAARLVAGTRGFGMYVSTNSGATWAASNAGFTSTLVTSIAVDRAAPDVMLAGTRTSGAFRSVDRGVTWSRLLESESPLASIDALWLEGMNAFAVVNTPATASGKLLRSMDFGATWTESATGLPGGPYRAFLATPTRTLINHCFGDVFSSDATGAAFTALNAPAGPADAGVCVSGFAIDPTAQGRLFVSSGAGAPNDGVLISLDDGATWTTSRTGLPAGAIPGPLAFGPDGRLWLGVSGSGGGVFASNDLGQTWVNVPGVLGDVRILLMDVERDRMYAATSATLFGSTDRGATWLALDFGLPTIDVSALALGAGQDLVFAGTRAAGLHVYRDLEVMPPDAGAPDGGSTTDGTGGVLGACGCNSTGAVLAALALVALKRKGSSWRRVLR